MIFENIEAISSGLVSLARDIPAKRVRIHKAPDQIERRTVIPGEFIAPVASFFVKQALEVARLHLPEVEELDRLGLLLHGSIIAPPRFAPKYYSRGKEVSGAKRRAF